jgi:hypothetical protein
MLGLDRPAGKRTEERGMAGDLSAQVEGDGLLQMLVCRG